MFVRCTPYAKHAVRGKALAGVALGETISYDLARSRPVTE